MPNILYRILLILSFVLINNHAFGENTNKTLLEQLKEQVDVKDLSSIIALEQKAQKESNDLSLVLAYYYKSGYFHSPTNYSKDSIDYYTRLGFEKLDLLKSNLDKFTKDEIELYQFLKIKLTNLIVDSYLLENKNDLALIYISRTLKDANLGALPVFEYEAYYLLGVCYLHTHKGKEALESFKKASSIYNKDFAQSPFSYHNVFRGMVHAYFLLDDYDNSIAVNDNVRQMIEDDYAASGADAYAYYRSLYVINNETALAWIKKGNFEKARKKLDESKEIYSNQLIDNPLVHTYYEVEAQYYSAKKDYQRAKKYINTSLDSAYAKIVYQNSHNYIAGNLIKADILHESGDNIEAYDLLRKLYQLNDSVNSTNFSSQVAEIQTLYNIDKLELESERDKMKLRNMQYLLSGISLMSLLLVYIVYVSRRNARILKKKNRQLVNQFSEIEKNKQIIFDYQLSQDNNAEAEQLSNINSNKVLAQKLDLYLKNSLAYRNPNLTREELALELGTNRQYLIEAIKEQTGKTYNEYIYSLRLKYAYDMIIKEKTKSISEIYLSAGFQTKVTFNRAFKEVYGMTPSELRNAT